MKLRQRLIGAVVLAAIIIIFVPTLFKNSNTSSRFKNLNTTIPTAPPKPLKQPSTSDTQTNSEDMITMNNETAQAQSAQSIQSSQPAQSGQGQNIQPLASQQTTTANSSMDQSGATQTSTVPLPDSKFAKHSVFSPANKNILSENNTISSSENALPKNNNSQMNEVKQNDGTPGASTQNATTQQSSAAEPENYSLTQGSATSAQIQKEDNAISASEQKLMTIQNPRETLAESSVKKSHHAHSHQHAVKINSDTQSTTTTTTAASHKTSDSSTTLVKKSVEESIAVHNKPIAMPAAWVLQVGTFSHPANAAELVKKLHAKGFTAFSHKMKTAKGSILTRVLVGPETKHEEAEKIKKKLDTQMHMKVLVEPYKVTQPVN